MIDFSKVKAVAIPEGKVKCIHKGSTILWKGGYTNRVPLSIDENWNIYNGCGYKDGFRIRSGGPEIEQNGARITGFIPVKAGDVIRCAGWRFSYASAANTVNFSGGHLQLFRPVHCRRQILRHLHCGKLYRQYGKRHLQLHRAG